MGRHRALEAVATTDGDAHQARLDRLKAEDDALLQALAEAKRSGIEPGSPEADALAERHRASIERFYDVDQPMHVGLADMYVADERFIRYYDDAEPGLAQYVHDIVVGRSDR